MSRIKTKKQGVVNSLVWTQQDNDTATISFDGTDFDISDPTTFASTVNLANGTAAAPSLTFTNSTGVGLYRNAANVLGIATAGSERITIDASGNLSMTSPGRIKSASTVGAVTTSSTTTAVEYGDGTDHVTVLTLTDFALGDVAGAANKAVGASLYTFPAGVHYCSVAYQSLSMKVAGTAVASDTGLGSVIGSGVQAVLSGVGATSEDYITGQTLNTAAGGGAVGAFIGSVGATISMNLAAAIKVVYLNSAGTWNANNTGGLTATGTVVLRWTKIA